MADVSESPIGSLITEARNKAKGRNGFYVARSRTCSCEVEISYFSDKSTREHISRCVEHRNSSAIYKKGTTS